MTPTGFVAVTLLLKATLKTPLMMMMMMMMLHQTLYSWLGRGTLPPYSAILLPSSPSFSLSICSDGYAAG